MDFVSWRFWTAILLVILPAHPTSAADVTPQSVKAALPQLNTVAEQLLKKTGVPGMAIAVVYQDQVVYLKGFGVCEAGQDERVDEETVFQVASLSKSLTSTVLAAIVGEGIVDWDDRVIEHDPGFRLVDPWVTREVTLRDLLCHRSGLPDHAGDLLEDLGFGREDVLYRLRFENLGPFRAQYAYTNFGYTEAAVAGARAAGVAWEDLAAEKLFHPLGMQSSSYRFADYAAANHRARTHVRADGQWVARYVREPDAQAPAGGASSTVRDLAQWLRLQLSGGKVDGKQVVSTTALAETHRPQIISQPPHDPSVDQAGMYGLGWNVNYGEDGVRLGHSGAFELGAATAVSMLPGEGLGIVVLTNAAPIGLAEAVCASFFDLVLKGKVERDWLKTIQPIFEAMSKPPYGMDVDYTKPPAEQSPPLAPSAYLGTYRNDYFGTLEVVEKDGGLHMLLGPQKGSFPLRHWDRDVFTYQPSGENAGGLSGVTFWVGPDETANRVVVENLDVEHQGTFSRMQTPNP